MINNALIPQHGGKIGTTVPIVTTGSVTSITYTDATAAGTVTSDGGATVTNRGICWSSSTSTPTYPASSYATSGSGTGAFTASLTSLTAGTTYYYRAFAVNSVGTGYGSVLTFSTTAYTAPIISAAPDVWSAPCSNDWTYYYIIDSDGGSPVTSNGLILSSNNYSITPVVYTNTGTGMFITGVINNTGAVFMYLTAYATNAYGTTYSATRSIRPYQGAGMGAITFDMTTATYVIVSSTINVTGYVCYPAEGGVVLGTSSGPTVASNFKKTVYSTNITSSGTMSGMLITGLTSHTTYYIRAYGGASGVWGYGAETTFTTP